MSDEATAEAPAPVVVTFTQAAEAWDAAAQAAPTAVEAAAGIAMTQRELDALMVRAREIAGPTSINISVSGAAFDDIASWRIVVDGTMHTVRMEARGPGCVVAQVDDHEAVAEDEANAVKLLVRSLCEAGRVVSGVAAPGVVMK